MRKRKEEIEGPWRWIKTRVRSDIENYFIFIGIFMIIIFFMLSSTIGGPYIVTTIKHIEDDTVYTEIPTWNTHGFYSYDHRVYMDIPIWIVFIYMGSVSLLLGFLLKIPRLIKGMEPRLRLFTLVGLMFSGGNMIGITLLFLFWFGGLYTSNIHKLEPILLPATICASALYLIFDWIVIKRGYRKHLPL